MASRFGVLCLFLTTLFTTLISAGNVTFSSFEQEGPDNQIYALAVNVPSPSTSNDLYFTFRGPAACSWVAFGLGGQGQQMDGALIFVAYLSENGKNITVSPRLGTGHSQPQYTSDVKVTIMNDTHYESGINGGYFVNFHCSNCRSWAGGNSIDITSTTQAMIFAMGPDGSLNSDDMNANIEQHNFGSMGGFTLNLKQATGAGGLPSEADLTSGSDSSSSSGGDSHHSISVGLHALLMVGSFLVVLPAGYLALRVLEKVWLHWAIQSFGLFATVLGSVAGIAISKKQQISPNLTNPHQIVGFVALFLMLITWTAGLLGHLHFRRSKISRTTIPQKSHRILGPLTVSVGLVNGILGFRFAGNNRAIIGYVIVVTIMVGLVSLVMMMKKRRSLRKNAMMTPAAQNFRQGHAEGGYMPPNDEAAVPLQDYQTGYSGAGGDMGAAHGPPPTYGEAGGYYAPPPGRPT